MMRLSALVALGGALGSLGRFWLSLACTRLIGPGFPWGTILINVLGSLAIGWLAGAATRSGDAASLQAFAMVGVCGGFTTFSAFSLQTLDLLRAGRGWEAAANAGLSVTICVAAAWIGGRQAVLF